jgi:hypothetical protein
VKDGFVFLYERKVPAAIQLQGRPGFGNATGVLKILTKLNLATAVAQFTGQHNARVPFNETHGKVTIAGGCASTIDPLVLENFTLQMALMGRYDLAHKTVDGHVIVNLLLVTDEIIHKLPIISYILLGDGKGLTPIWFSAKGAASDPDIRFLPIKTIASPFWNTAAHIFHLPEKFLKKVRSIR